MGDAGGRAGAGIGMGVALMGWSPARRARAARGSRRRAARRRSGCGGLRRWRARGGRCADSRRHFGDRVGLRAAHAAARDLDPDVQGQHHHRRGAIPPEEQRVVAAEPALQRLEAVALAARLDLGLHRLGAADIEIDVGAVAAIPNGAGERHAFGAEAALRVDVDDGALAAQALVAGGFAHRRSHAACRWGTGARMFACAGCGALVASRVCAASKASMSSTR